jgi:hypothetical protein
MCHPIKGEKHRGFSHLGENALVFKGFSWCDGPPSEAESTLLFIIEEGARYG